MILGMKISKCSGVFPRNPLDFARPSCPPPPPNILPSYGTAQVWESPDRKVIPTKASPGTKILPQKPQNQHTLMIKNRGTLFSKNYFTERLETSKFQDSMIFFTSSKTFASVHIRVTIGSTRKLQMGYTRTQFPT